MRTTILQTPQRGLSEDLVKLEFVAYLRSISVDYPESQLLTAHAQPAWLASRTSAISRRSMRCVHPRVEGPGNFRIKVRCHPVSQTIWPSLPGGMCVPLMASGLSIICSLHVT